jgi:hypothetical protein
MPPIDHWSIGRLHGTPVGLQMIWSLEALAGGGVVLIVSFGPK